MEKKVYEVILDIWRLGFKYRFRFLDDEKWKCFVEDGDTLLNKYRGQGMIERFYREMFGVMQHLYEQIGGRE